MKSANLPRNEYHVGQAADLFEIVITHSLLTPRCSDSGDGSLTLFTSADGALWLLLGGERLSSGSTLSSEHLVPQIVGQFSVLGRQLAQSVPRDPIVPTAECQ